jgi:hypothetical protein
MSTTYQTIIDKAEIVLQDAESDQTLRRWPESEILTWATDSEIEIAKLKEDSYPVIEVVKLVEGSQQPLPDRATQLMDVLSNMSTDGTTRGDIVSVVDKKLMNAINPSWMVDTAKSFCTHVIYDTLRSPKIYWVYPQSTGTNYLEIMCNKLPDNGAKVIGDDILLADEYTNSMLHYILAMCFAKDFDIPNSQARTAIHMNIFLESLGRKEMAEEMYHPKRTKGNV